ncbi:hypothetical protein ACPA54_02775 [Uniformispora flossi]|uniref:hypothetical protein n=1 Tax=Uniformispora flossi TaxID=3390723 RepID=UPI003C2BD7A3
MTKPHTPAKLAAVGAALAAALTLGTGTASATSDPNVQKAFYLNGHRVANVQFQPRDGQSGDEHLYISNPVKDKNQIWVEVWDGSRRIGTCTAGYGFRDCHWPIAEDHKVFIDAYRIGVGTMDYLGAFTARS